MGAAAVYRVPPQQGRTFLITGSTSGLGLECARALASAGAKVVVSGRNPDRVAAVAGQLRAEVADAEVADAEVADAEVAELPLDLADLTAVRQAVDRFRDEHGHLDVLINNAGVMAAPHRTTADGFELHIGTNHLGHFALTGLLLDLVVVAEDPRVVTVSSGMHLVGRLDLDDLHWQRRRYHRWRAYSDSKLANLLFSAELQRRLVAADLGHVRSVAAHPGYAATHLQTAGVSMDPSLHARWQQGVMAVLNRVVAQSAADGALPVLRAAIDPDAPPGSFWGPASLGGLRGRPTRSGRSRRARDKGLARGLWERSEALTGIRYP